MRALFPLAAALCLIPVAAAAPPATKPVVAISYFDNHSTDPALAPLAKGLADMLITDLLPLGSIQVVERARLNQVLSELSLSKSKFIDPRTAVKLGKGLAAKYILTGGYTVAGDGMRIDARLLEVETGKVLASEKVEGKKDDFFALEKELVDVLCTALDLELTRADKTRLRGNPTQSYGAWTAYAEGLDASDRGDAAAARARFEKALALDPAYAAARTALERLAVMFQQSDKETLAYVENELRGLDPKSPGFARKIDELLLRLDWGKDEQSRRKTALLTWLAQRKLLACTRTAGPAPGSPHVIIDGVPQGGVISHCRQVHEVLRIAYELLDDPTQWTVIPRLCERFIPRLPDDKALVSYCENTVVPSIVEAQKEGADAGTVHDSPRMKAMLAAYAGW
jgi:TolB-like protein